MEWVEKKSSELYVSSSGLSKSSDQFGYGYPFLSYKDVFNNYYAPDKLSTLVNSTEKDRMKCSVKQGDVFLTRTSETTDELGMSCVALHDYVNATFNGFTKRLRPLTDEIEPKYAAYYFRSPYFRSQCISLASLITRASLNDGMIRRLKIRYPLNRKVQEKIGEILYTYDTLIENNTKRIRLLEKMAENLYKEWFVRFRFPGHENVEMENGLPKGWKMTNLFDVADVTYGFAFKSNKFCDNAELNPVVRIRDIQENHTNTYTDEQCEDKYLIGKNAILIGMDGIFHMCLWNGERAYMNQRVVMLNSKEKGVCNYLLYLAIRPQIKYWEQVISGTTVAHLGDKHLRKVKVLLPEKAILEKANSIISRAMDDKNILQHQNSLLARQRDLLLPRLMSGKLEVKEELLE